MTYRESLSGESRFLQRAYFKARRSSLASGSAEIYSKQKRVSALMTGECRLLSKQVV